MYLNISQIVTRKSFKITRKPPPNNPQTHQERGASDATERLNLIAIILFFIVSMQIKTSVSWRWTTFAVTSRSPHRLKSFELCPPKTGTPGHRKRMSHWWDMEWDIGTSKCPIFWDTKPRSKHHLSQTQQRMKQKIHNWTLGRKIENL